MNYVTLPIYFHTNDTTSLRELGIAYKLSDCEIRQMEFFTIGAISDYVDDSIDEKLTSIFTNGYEFICAYDRQTTLDKILESKLLHSL